MSMLWETLVCLLINKPIMFQGTGDVTVCKIKNLGNAPLSQGSRILFITIKKRGLQMADWTQTIVTYHIKFFKIMWEKCGYVIYETLMYKCFLFLFHLLWSLTYLKVTAFFYIPFFRDLHQVETKLNGFAAFWKSPTPL